MEVVLSGLVPLWDSHLTGLPGLTSDVFAELANLVLGAADGDPNRIRMERFCAGFLKYPAPCKTALVMAKALLSRGSEEVRSVFCFQLKYSGLLISLMIRQISMI